jgi:p-cumate 2,3-dioxygenase ferredoxin subunit
MSKDARHPADPSLVRICAAADVPDDEPLKVELDGRAAIAVYQVQGAFYATDDLCSHGEASLSEGIIEDFQILCPFHMGGFDVRTGEVMAPPCQVPIRAYAVSDVAGVLYARIDG